MLKLHFSDLQTVVPAIYLICFARSITTDLKVSSMIFFARSNNNRSTVFRLDLPAVGPVIYLIILIIFSDIVFTSW